MEAVLETLHHSPLLSLYYRKIGEWLDEEQRKRQKFYDSMTEEQKIEFINGEEVMQSPAKLEHNVASNHLNILLSAYVACHDLGYVGHEKMLISLTRNDYEPDVCFWRKEKSEAFGPKQIHFPAPDFIAEVLSPFTEESDREIKFQDYAAHRVQEYWIIDPDRKFVEQYVLSDEQYKLVQKTDSGILRSAAVQGFRIPTVALFDQQEQFKVLREIVGT
jgi:Uma2 family endonuclease